MFILPDDTFKDLMKNPKNANIARRIFNSSSYDSYYISEDSLEDTITAQGKFTYYSEEYLATLVVDGFEEKVLSFDCNCPWCSSTIPCGHIGSLILLLQDTTITLLPLAYAKPEYPAFPIHENRILTHNEYIQRRELDESKELVTALKELHSKTIKMASDEQLTLYPVFNISSSYRHNFQFTLDFKIGGAKLYVIKDILALLRHIDDQEFVVFGKNLSCRLSYDAFDSDSQLMIQFLKRNIHPTVYNDQYRSFRSFSISDNNIDDFYETFSGLEIKTQFSFVETDDKLTLEFEPSDYGCHFNLTTTLYSLTSTAYYKLNVKTNTLTRFLFNNPSSVNKLFELTFNNDLNFVSFEDANQLYQLLLKDCLEDFELINFPFSTIEKNEVIDVELYGDISSASEVEFALHFIHNDGTKTYGFSNDNIPADKNCLSLTSFFEKNATRIDFDMCKALFDLDDEKTYTFIHEGLPQLKEYCTIFISDNLKRIGVSKKYSISVGVHLKSDLLEFDFNTLDFPIEELADILKNYRRSKKFYRLKNGDLMHLVSDDLQELDALMHDNHLSIESIKNGKLKTSAFRAFAVENSFTQTSNLLIDRKESFKNCLDNFKSSEVNFSVDKHYDSILRSYQTTGIQWIGLLEHYNFNGILADDMGLGKTLQVIAFIDSCKSWLPNLVICPSSLILNWESEIKKFSPHMKCIAIHGPQAERHKAIARASKFNICITSYDYLRRDIEKYEKVKFNYSILDEAQYIKNQNTKNAKSVKMLNSNHRLALTGTPIENSLAELWSIFDFLMPDYLFNYHYFKKNFETPIAKQNDVEISQKLKKLVEPFILRRLKTTVLKELPEKIEQTITIDFNEDEEKVYLAHALQVASNLREQINLGSVDKIQILAMLIKLRQLCIEPRLLFENFTTPSSKMEACLNIIHSFKENNKKILLFSSFPSVFTYFVEEFKKAGIKYHIISGKTDKVDRHTYVDEFQQDDSTVFLISLKAGGTGLNLTAAEGVIHFDPWWNVSAQNQATDRSHRIGQKNVVQVYKLIMRNSIEEKILHLQELKKNLADTFIEDSEGSIGSLSNEQLLDLFNIN